jgi:hypothetical protein
MGLFDSIRVTHFFHRRVLGSISRGLIVTASSTVVRWGMTIRGERFRARFNRATTLLCGRSKDPNHDAVMGIGSEGPKRRTHSSNRHESQGTCRESATSNRHRCPITSVPTGPSETSPSCGSSWASRKGIGEAHGQQSGASRVEMEVHVRAPPLPAVFALSASTKKLR